MSLNEYTSHSLPEPDLTVTRNPPHIIPGNLVYSKDGATPFKELEVEFTDIQPSKGFRYLLVIICTYSGWVKDFPTTME